MKPNTFADLYSMACVLALVRAVRTERRKRTESAGESWEKNTKGRYECTLIQTFVAVGRAMNIDEGLLAPIINFVPKIDPSVVGSKIQADGTVKHVYEDRKIGPRHAEMLKVFSEVSALRRFFEAPNLLWSKALPHLQTGTELQIRHAALARSALILRIVQRVCPMRRSNIARLRIAGENPHIQLPVGPGEGTLYLPANEMKNLRALHVRIDADTVEMIREFVEVFRPISMEHAKAHPENEHLFPGGCGIRKERGPDKGYSEGFGYFTLSKLNNTFKKHLGKHSMINVDLQVMRHLAGKVILDQDPSAMGLVQEILAHKKIETTRAYYAEVCGLVAQARYLDLLDKATRKALANVSFKIQIEKELV
jgi:integrase